MAEKVEPGPLLSKIADPHALRSFSLTELEQLCLELRKFLIDHVSIYGGHFASNLGSVEMTVAIHYVFDTPHDLLIWDVGHQAYGHKILTGRREKFHTNRKYGGLSGFPSRGEGPYDPFGVGHSSTSISAALGMAIANDHQRLRDKKHDKKHIAVIGDGAMTGGMAFEALNHAGWEADKHNLLVVLNDNGMSIDPNVGALKEYLTKMTLSPTYNKIRDEVWNLMGRLKNVGKNAQEIAGQLEHSLKGFLSSRSNFFESLNIRYYGPVDGHNVEQLIKYLKALKDLPGPKILHCFTVKGKGYPQAEASQTTWHAPGLFDKMTGKVHSSQTSSEPGPLKYQEVFGHSLLELARKNDKIMGITPAMPSGSSMNIMMAELPDRVFDVGIAEQHAVTFSAGMVTQGLIPFCHIYSTFMQRGYDQLIHDVCVQNLPVNFVLDRGGLVGEDGATHHGAYDLAFMRCLPHLIIASPLNEEELRNFLYTMQLSRSQRPFSIRYPRGKGTTPKWKTPMKKIPIGKGRCLREGEKIAILSIGHIGNIALEVLDELAAENIFPALYDMRFVKPLDEDLLHKICGSFEQIISLEDGCLMGGFGSAILEFLAQHEYFLPVRRLGIPDQIIKQGKPEELHKLCGYDKGSIQKVLRAQWKRSPKRVLPRSR
ncbi:MAG: 1-deoxy-D-xylulose-5-phosphate synthase [Cytophagales bacterium]|nr:1-deoxy-D-xylulose-5-phosphate synthase [Cytophagales bacterium]